MIIKGNSVGYPLPDPRKGLSMEGGIHMNGQKLKGLTAPEAEDEPVNLKYFPEQVPKLIGDALGVIENGSY